MSQITIRDLEPQVERYIRQRAAKEGVSLSRAASRLLAKAAGLAEMDFP
jgi:plasmid stability protein